MAPRVKAASQTLPPEPSSVRTARRYVQATLSSLGLSGAWEAAELLISEVATNAVLHARTDFTVEVLARGDVVRVSVRDRSHVLPTQRRYGTEATTGRGIRLVATLAAAWGTEQQPDGKVVWFEVHAARYQKDVSKDEARTSDVDVDALIATFCEPEGATARPVRTTSRTLVPAAAALRRAA